MSVTETPGAIDGSNREAKDYPVNEIPLLLYDDLSRHLTLGEETEVYSRNRKYHLRRLNPNHNATGFPGAIGIEKSYDHVKFVLWPRVPEGVKDSVFEPDPILIIDAGPRHTGTWFIGKGHHITEDIRADLPLLGISLKSESIRLISLILYRAAELTKDPKCIKDSYWENNRFPGG